MRKLLGVWRGGGRWGGWSGAGLPKGGLVDTPTYIPQNDPHDALIIWNIHNWGKKFFRKNFPISSGSHQPRSRSGVKFFLCVFHPFVNSPPNSEYLEYRHVGLKKNPSRGPKKKFRRLWRQHFPRKSQLENGGFVALPVISTNDKCDQHVLGPCVLQSCVCNLAEPGGAGRGNP